MNLSQIFNSESRLFFAFNVAEKQLVRKKWPPPWGRGWKHEEAGRRPYGYLLIDLKTTTQDDCRLRTNVLPGEEGFNQVVIEENIPQELLRYLKQQNLSSDPLLPAMQRLQSRMDGILARGELGEDEKAKQFLQLQNRYLTFNKQLNTHTPLPARNKPEEMSSSQPDVNLSTSLGDSTTVTTPSTPLNPFNVAPNLSQRATLQGPKAVTPTPSSPAILTVVTAPPFVLPSCLCFPFFLLVRVICYFN